MKLLLFILDTKTLPGLKKKKERKRRRGKKKHTKKKVVNKFILSKLKRKMPSEAPVVSGTCEGVPG